MVIGHEFVGRIVEIGSNVHDFRVGDLVSAEGHVVCGHCRNCLAGRRHLCNAPLRDRRQSRRRLCRIHLRAGHEYLVL